VRETVNLLASTFAKCLPISKLLLSADSAVNTLRVKKVPTF